MRAQHHPREICFNLKNVLSVKGYNSEQKGKIFEAIRKELENSGHYQGLNPYKMLILDDAVAYFVPHPKDEIGRFGKTTFAEIK